MLFRSNGHDGDGGDGDDDGNGIKMTSKVVTKQQQLEFVGHRQSPDQLPGLGWLSAGTPNVAGGAVRNAFAANKAPPHRPSPQPPSPPPAALWLEQAWGSASHHGAGLGWDPA